METITLLEQLQRLFEGLGRVEYGYWIPVGVCATAVLSDWKVAVWWVDPPSRLARVLVECLVAWRVSGLRPVVVLARWPERGRYSGTRRLVQLAALLDVPVLVANEVERFQRVVRGECSAQEVVKRREKPSLRELERVVEEWLRMGVRRWRELEELARSLGVSRIHLWRACRRLLRRRRIVRLSGYYGISEEQVLNEAPPALGTLYHRRIQQLRHTLVQVLRERSATDPQHAVASEDLLTEARARLPWLRRFYTVKGSRVLVLRTLKKLERTYGVVARGPNGYYLSQSLQIVQHAHSY